MNTSPTPFTPKLLLILTFVFIANCLYAQGQITKTKTTIEVTSTVIKSNTPSGESMVTVLLSAQVKNEESGEETPVDADGEGHGPSEEDNLEEATEEATKEFWAKVKDLLVSDKKDNENSQVMADENGEGDKKGPTINGPVIVIFGSPSLPSVVTLKYKGVNQFSNKFKKDLYTQILKTDE